MKRVVGIILAVTIALTFTTGTVNASVDGITKDNYMDYVKPYADEYGYNIGECDRPYFDGEEYFYNEYYDHWNVDKVYDESLIPTGWNQATEVKAISTPTKKVITKEAKKKKKIKVKKKSKKKIKK